LAIRKINIAIDGYSSCGKSTLAQSLAHRLEYDYVDSGAMYRAVTLYALRLGLGESDFQKIIDSLPLLDIDCRWSPSGNTIWLNNENISDAIRQPEVQNLVSQISTLSAVRRFLVKEQKALALQKGVVMDGRDIGTVVLPDAELKVFMTASLEVRVHRRYLELKAKGIDLDPTEVESNLKLRDHIDSTRDDSPLRQAEDAILLDNSTLTISQQLDLVLEWVQEKIQIK
jgi:CMP/dCMP kinase